MRFATSSCKALLRSDLRRYWPVFFCYTFLWILVQPISLWNSARLIPEEGSLQTIFAGQVYGMLTFTVVSAAVFGVILAMTLYGYLMKSNSVGLMHALPMSRTAQYFTHFGAGMLMMTVGSLVVFALSVLMELRLGAVEWKSLLWWLLFSELLVFFCFAFTTMCAMITGWTLGIPVIFLGVGFMVKIYSLLLSGMGSTFYYGYTLRAEFTGLERWLTPLYNLYASFADIQTAVYDEAGHAAKIAETQAAKAAVIYAIIGVGMLLLGWLFYRQRQSETAGDAIVFRWLKPVVRYVIAIAGGLGLGVGVYAMLDLENDRGSELFLLVCQLVMGFVTYCAVEMLMRKRFKVFDKRTWVGLAVLAAIIIGLFAGMKMDITGYETRIPETAEVEGVSVSCDYLNDVYDEDPAFIELVRQVHNACLDKKGAEAPEDPDSTEYYLWFRVDYTLKNGGNLSREYNVPLAEGDSAIEAVNRLVNSDIAKREGYFHGSYDVLCQDEAIGGYIYLWNIDDQIQITEAQAKALQQAVLQDVETLPDRSVTDDCYNPLSCGIELDMAEETTIYLNDLTEDFKEVSRLIQEYGVLDMVDVTGTWELAEEQNSRGRLLAAFGESYADAELSIYGDKTFAMTLGEVAVYGIWERSAGEVFATDYTGDDEVVYRFTYERINNVDYLALDGAAVGVDGLALYWKLQ